MALMLMTLITKGADKDVLGAMRKATQYMMDVASYNGGFVWNYLPDYSRQWGELEARRTMVWLQSPGTPDVGEVLLDAYHATGDEYYYESARCVALCIIQGQLPCGGWNYVFDMEPEDSLKNWYATIGRQAWRLEEFQHYYGNATFDDGATKHCAEFLLRIYLEKKDETFGRPLRKAIDFMLESQYDNGGWPQRYPLMYDHPFKGKADYTSFITLNDNVMVDNIDFLLQCYTSLGMSQLRDPILKAMWLLRDLQQPKPYAGWADQYTPGDLKPAHARSYEPKAVNTGTTIAMIEKMMEFYRITGDKSFLQGIPDAIDFLESQRLSDTLTEQVRRTPLQVDEFLMPRFINPDNGQPLYVHRKGSNVVNGSYYTDEVTMGTIAHYSSFTTVNTDRLRQTFADVKLYRQQDLERNSPLKVSQNQGPKAFYFQPNSMRRSGMPAPSVNQILASLNDKGYWPVTLRQVSYPYKPIPSKMSSDSDDNTYSQTMAGDEYDTSPYANQEVRGISTGAYIQNMTTLIASLRKKAQPTVSGLDPERFEETVEGKQTHLYTLKNQGLEACITNYGARLVSLMVPDVEGNYDDVVLGFDNVGDYHLRKNNFGSIIGRYAGRIKGAQFMLEGKPYRLQQTGGGNISHGGYPGFADKVWDVVEKTDTTLRMRLVSPDGENGFPGKLTVDVIYTLTYNHSLLLDYEATTDKPTVINLTNHTFFNISGHPEKDVLGQKLRIDGKYIATYDKDKNVDGNFMKVRNTPFDFTSEKTIGADIEIYDEQMGITKGYDHSYLLRHPGDVSVPAAILFDEESGRQLTVYTTEPALHFYSANGLNGSLEGKNGIRYQKQSAVCFETMHFADAPNQPSFPSTTLLPGETYRSHTAFVFSGRTPKKRNLLRTILVYGGAASLTGLGVVGVLSLIH